MTHAVRPRGQISVRFMAALLLFVGGVLATDVVDDLRAGVRSLHVLIEMVAGILAAVGLGTVLREVITARRQAHHLAADLERVRGEAAHWREEARSYLGGLGAAIDHQFMRWNLTTAERDVGLLLKGLSLKEIADVRQTSERTVRQQSLAVYRKSGLSGRAELAAFFLEDLMLPGQPAEGPKADLIHI